MRLALALAVSVIAISSAHAQRRQAPPPPANEAEKPPERFSAATFSGLKFRNIGPAMMSGRIADIELHPQDPATWYVGVGSGGVWKTQNAGTTWTPVFDSQPSYSIGAMTLDPQNPDVIYVGTGENVGGRHVGYGDGLYRSADAGKTWTNIGLKGTEHISEIIVHPKDSNVIFVAAQGPLWNKGGERGLYKSTDGGKTWKAVLAAGPWTGVTDVVMDPREPNRLYAATWQRHRTVAAYVGGGPETALHKSEDGGETWTKLAGGLPSGNLGKIGLAISPQNPDVVYAAIELERRTGGVWRSDNRGASWSKMSDTVSGGTGPHYYQELYASPHKFDQIYLANVQTLISDDGGRNFRPINTRNIHVDHHALAFRKDDPDYLLVGSDGGLYESWDYAQNWRFIGNLPVTQFYKVAVDDAVPFYNVYGGTQDNSSQGGPSRTDNRHGIRNSDWFITVFADGHQPATEPGNPNIVYSHWQEGNLVRFDKITGEVVHIQPQAKPGEPAERFNWDAPILVSAHDPKRIYHASYRVWRSDNRGDAWRAISGDLTSNQDKMTTRLMDRQWSWDAVWDMTAMSAFATITSLAESPVDENILYAGTDDGLIQATSDGGATWTAIRASSLPGVPAEAFVNDIRADLFDANTVYVALDNHKNGDYRPMLYKSTDRGRSWRSIAGDLPDRHLVWRVVQDHVNRNLLFAATEFGIFFTVDGGGKWVELTGGMPTISIRDVTIQRRENDLVGASFGRSFFVLDDYTPLRSIDRAALEREALLFQPRKAWWYIEQHPIGFSPGGSLGDDLYRAPNPPFGAVFTYHLADGLKSAKDIRQEREKPLVKDGRDTPFPGFAAVDAELRAVDPEIWLTVRDSGGNVVRRLKGPSGRGFHRIAWDLRTPAVQTVPAGGGGGPQGAGSSADATEPSGFLVAPGNYSVQLSKMVDGVMTDLSEPLRFEVQRMREGALPGTAPAQAAAFWQELSLFQRDLGAVNAALGAARTRVNQLRTAVQRTQAAPGGLDTQWRSLKAAYDALDLQVNGSTAADQIGVPVPATLGQRLQSLLVSTANATYGPTATQREQYDFARTEFADVRTRLKAMIETDIPALERAITAAGGPAIAGGTLQ